MSVAVPESSVVPGQVQACPIGVRHVPEAADFVYVMRRDSDYVVRQFVARLDLEDAFAEVLAAYDRAVDTLAEALLRAFSTVHERPAIDLIDGNDVHRRRLELIAAMGIDALVVSMDPLMEDALPFAFSRCYRPGGVEFIEMIPRPGYPSLPEQVEHIAAQAAGRPLIVVEDDFYTGTTIENTLGEQLGELAQSIAGVVAGTRVGTLQPRFPVHAAVRYVREGDRDPLEKVDLGDPRDYVIGASGLVCRLESGDLGRLPYVLPFVSPAARASVPEAAEATFSAEAHELSREFYADLSRIAGAPVTLAAADPYFAVACAELIGIPADAPMADVLSQLEPAS